MFPLKFLKIAYGTKKAFITYSGYLSIWFQALLQKTFLVPDI